MIPELNVNANNSHLIDLILETRVNWWHAGKKGQPRPKNKSQPEGWHLRPALRDYMASLCLLFSFFLFFVFVGDILPSRTDDLLLDGMAGQAAALLRQFQTFFGVRLSGRQSQYRRGGDAQPMCFHL